MSIETAERELGKLVTELRKWADRNEHSFSRTVSARLMRQAADALERTEWISVENRLPAEHVWVLACAYSDIHESQEIVVAECVGQRWQETYIGEYAVTDVTHWMPLPKTPPLLKD